MTTGGREARDTVVTIRHRPAARAATVCASPVTLSVTCWRRLPPPTPALESFFGCPRILGDPSPVTA